MPGSRDTRPANRAVRAASSSAGKRSSSTAGRLGPRLGASRPESCMMQMPDRPYSVNCTSPVSAARVVCRSRSSREAAALARMPARDRFGFATCKAVRQG